MRTSINYGIAALPGRSSNLSVITANKNEIVGKTAYKSELNPPFFLFKPDTDSDPDPDIAERFIIVICAKERYT